MKPLKILACSLGALALIHSWAFASPPKVSSDDFAEERVYSPYAGRNYPDAVLFGGIHFHTDLSFDAGLIGTRLDVDAGYRFARGEN